MVIEASVFIKAPIEKVWNTFIDLTCWADWNTVISNVKCSETSCIDEGSEFQCKVHPFSIPVSFTARVIEVVRFEKVIWKAERFGISSIHEFLFEREGEGVIVKSKETFRGIPLILFKRLFPEGEVKALTERLLSDLKKVAEENTSV